MTFDTKVKVVYNLPRKVVTYQSNHLYTVIRNARVVPSGNGYHLIISHDRVLARVPVNLASVRYVFT